MQAKKLSPQVRLMEYITTCCLQARISARKGDVDVASVWLLCAKQHLSVLQSLEGPEIEEMVEDAENTIRETYRL